MFQKFLDLFRSKKVDTTAPTAPVLSEYSRLGEETARLVEEAKLTNTVRVSARQTPSLKAKQAVGRSQRKTSPSVRVSGYNSRRETPVVDDSMSLLNPLNIMSPFSPLNPMNSYDSSPSQSSASDSCGSSSSHSSYDSGSSSSCDSGGGGSD